MTLDLSIFLFSVVPAPWKISPSRWRLFRNDLWWMYGEEYLSQCLCRPRFLFWHYESSIFLQIGKQEWYRTAYDQQKGDVLARRLAYSSLPMPEMSRKTTFNTFYQFQKKTHILIDYSSPQAMYEEKKIVFLTDEQDTVEYYEQKGKNDCVNRPSSNDRLMTALSSLDRVQQVEAITEYQSFSAELKEYLKTFADNKRIVREEDITEFFGRLKERKRRRLDDPTGGMPHFCRWTIDSIKKKTHAFIICMKNNTNPTHSTFPRTLSLVSPFPALYAICIIIRTPMQMRNITKRQNVKQADNCLMEIGLKLQTTILENLRNMYR